MMPIEFPKRIQLAALPTPLQALNRLTKALNQPLKATPRIWLKRDDLTGSLLTGNKVRKLEFILARALDEGYDTLITCGGIQSNHCRATAVAAAQLGLHCHLVLRATEAEAAICEANTLIDQLVGAEVSYYPPKTYFKTLETIFSDLVDHYASQGRKALVIPTGGSDAVGVWGYIRACEELAQDFKTHKLGSRVIVTATGSGGTQAGLTVGSKLFNLQSPVYGINVCDDEAYFLEKVSTDIASWQSQYDISDADYRLANSDIRVIDGYVGAGYGKLKDNDSVINTIKMLAKLEGVILDPVYTGKAFDALLQEIKKGRFADVEDIVFIHTGGVFGVFPYGDYF